MPSQAGHGEAQVDRHSALVSAADYRRPTPSTDASAARHDGGGALQRFLASALAAILTLVFAWQILLGVRSEETTRGESRDDAEGSGAAAAAGRDCEAGRCTAAGSTSINQRSVQLGGADDAVTHDNAAADRHRTAPAPQPGAARRPALPAGSWNVTSARRAPAEHPSPSMTDSVLSDMPSRNSSGVAELAETIDEQVRLSSKKLSSTSNNKCPPAARRSGESAGSLLAATVDADSGEWSATAAMNDGEVPSYRRRPLMWSTSTASDDEPAAGSPRSCNSDDDNFFHAWMTQDPAEENDVGEDDDGTRKSVRRDDDDDEDTHDVPEVTTSSWISLFRTFFVGRQQQQRPTAPPAAVPSATGRLRDRDVINDLLDRSLSTISEEAGDELARKMSELDDDLHDAQVTAWHRESENGVNSSSYFDGGGDDDVFYSDSNMYRLADDAVR